MKNLLKSIIFTVVFVLSLTACTSGKVSIYGTQQRGRLGNENYNISNGGQVDEENDWIYYGLGHGLYKCKEDGTCKEKLFEVEGGVYSINVIKNWVYFRSNGIHRIKTDGTSYEQIASEDVRGGVHFIDGKIYNGSEYRMNIDGSKKERIYDSNAACGYTLNIVDGWIYFYDKDLENKNSFIFKMRLDGSEYQSIYEGRTDYMVVDGDWIYFVDYKEYKNIYKLKTDGSEKYLITETPNKVGSIIVRDDWIYYISDGINKIKTDGTEETHICDNVYPKNDIQLHGDWLYFEEKDILYRVKTDGSDFQKFAEI